MQTRVQKPAVPAGAVRKPEPCQVLRQLLHSGAIQAKLTVSQPGDPLEREADQVADQVMRMPAVIQRKCACSSGGHTCDKCAEEEKVQAKEAPGRTPSMTPDSEAHIESLRGGGQPLPSNVRSFFEPRFGRDFSNVRVHADSRANEAASAVQARAFALGRDIVFGAGQYAPQSAEGQKLLAHELTHVVQQSRSGEPSIQRQTYREDRKSCALTAKYTVTFAFLNKWTPERKDNFMAAAKSQIEGAFNRNEYRIVPAGANYQRSLLGIGLGLGDCPCFPAGFRPRVEITPEQGPVSSRSGDWTVWVRANTSGEFIRSHAAAGSKEPASLDEADVKLTTQTPIVHEFGHFLGLDHPGHGIPGADEYSHTGLDSENRQVAGTDLLGSGMGLRPFYFEPWVAHLNSEYSKCRYAISEEDKSMTQTRVQGMKGMQKATTTSPILQRSPSQPAQFESPKAPKKAGYGDLIKAFLELPEVKKAIEDFKKRFNEAPTAAKAGAVAGIAAVGAGGIAGIASNPEARKEVLGMLHGQEVPVPGVPGLKVQILTQDTAPKFDPLKGFPKPEISTPTGAGAMLKFEVKF